MPSGRGGWAAALTAGAALAWAARAGGQGAPPAAAEAAALAAQGDTVQAVALLEAAVRARRDDGAAWHLLGVLRWEQARRGRAPGFIRDAKVIRLLTGADTALRLATQMAPDSGRYHLALSRFSLESGLSTMRFAATGQADQALAAAVRAGDRPLEAQAADAVGMGIWRRYEPVAHRALVVDGQKIQLGPLAAMRRDRAYDYVTSFVKKIEPPTGTVDYTRALERFRQALAADPTSLRIARHAYMALAERDRWEELRTLAEQRRQAFPLDAQAPLALGLALHRLQRPREAQAAFDAGLALLDDEERDRLTRFTRVLRPRAGNAPKGTVADSAAYMKLPPAQRRGLEAMYWLLADPLAITPENEARLEFLARVVFADLRWTVDEVGLRGADSDRGDVYVRYGPPDYQVTIPGNSNTPAAAVDGGVTLVWSYRAGYTFFFDLPPGFGNARAAFADNDAWTALRDALPVSWGAGGTTRVVDSIPLRAVRFRAGADSSDLVVTARVPLDSLLGGLAVDRVPLDVDFRIFDQYVRVTGVDGTQVQLRPDSVAAALPRQWTRRLGPGINVVRVEALQADSRRAARAVVRLAPEPGTGFGVSDVLLGTRPATPAAPPARWRDVAMTAVVDVLPRGAPLGLVWELYEPAPRMGANRYRVEVAVRRDTPGGLGGAVLRVLEGVGRAVTREQRGRDAVRISFDRTVPAAAVQVESLALDLGDAPAGRYRLEVVVTDLVGNRTATRVTTFELR
jgi:GWxTD domain-containing protein